MYGLVQVPRRRLDEQRLHVGDEVVEAIHSLAAPLRGARVLNLSISPFGTGVAELLHSLVPLLRDLGIEADWQVIGCDAEFTPAVRLMYEGLSGRRVDWTPAVVESWHRYNDLSAALFDGSYDLVVVHDPQPAALPSVLAELPWATERAKWVWHCHLDLRNAQSEVWETLLPALLPYDLFVFQDRAFVPASPVGTPQVIIPPAIDPAGARNVELPHTTVRELLTRHGLDPDRPLVVQVGPLDPSFDPVGAIEAYRRAKVVRRDLQLLLVNPAAETSLEAWSRFERVARQAAGDPDSRVLISQGDGGHLVVNAAQRAASVVIQRSVPAGFAPQLWEAQWKGRAVVAGQAGGLPAQVADGVTGYQATNEEEFAEAILALIEDPAQATRFGAAGRCQVQQRHLITRFLADELRLLQALLDDTPSRSGLEVPTHA